MLMVWGKTQSNPSGDFTFSKAFNETPIMYLSGDGCSGVSNLTSTGFSTSDCVDPITYFRCFVFAGLGLK